MVEIICPYLTDLDSINTGSVLKIGQPRESQDVLNSETGLVICLENPLRRVGRGCLIRDHFECDKSKKMENSTGIY